jgi:Ribonucleotide reductase, barrel domain
MGDIADDLGSIFDHLREAALTMQQGGGIGYDFSAQRPKGPPVKGVGADASARVLDGTCGMPCAAPSCPPEPLRATMRRDHPDIEDFIAAKRHVGRLRHFNLSVLATDPFMAAVEIDADWPLRFGGKTYKLLRARALFDRITRATYDYAEPGVIFIDRINARNNLRPVAVAARPRAGSASPCPTRSHQPPPGRPGRAKWWDRTEPRRDLPRRRHDAVAGLAARSGESSLSIARHGAVQVDPLASSPARAKRRRNHTATRRVHAHQPDVRLTERVFDHTIFG